MHTCKKWTQKDKRRLMIAYNMGAKYSWLCQIFNRSKSAINKYLSRSGIRPLGVFHQPKLKGFFSFKDIWAEIHRVEALSPLNEPRVKKLFRKPVYFQALKKRPYDEPTIYCEDFQKPVKYLLSLGFRVKKIQSPFADYLINSQPLLSYQVIIMANRYRLHRALKPFIIKGFID